MTEHAQPGGFLIPETIRAELLSYVMEVPTELLRDYAWRPLTPEELAQRKAGRAATLTAMREAHAALLADAAGDTLAAEILTLHAPKSAGYLIECEGCDFGGYEGEAPEWPCRTYTVVAGRFGRRFVEGPYGTRMGLCV